MAVHDVSQQAVDALIERIDALEARVAALEARPAATRRSSGAGSAGSSGSGGGDLDPAGWTGPYPVARIEVSETWIELHEPSARPQLQRLIREVVEVEGPVTERLALDRVRRAWGLRRAGGRVQEAFDQAVRQLVARGLVERHGDALVQPGSRLEQVRVPTEDEESRRGAEDVPLVELALAMRRAVEKLGGDAAVDDLTMRVARLLGWTRRGGAIQERLDAALQLASDRGDLDVHDGVVRVASAP
jgi:hypothetical protein